MPPLEGRSSKKQLHIAHRAALEEWTRERVPVDWASMQDMLGVALRQLEVRQRSRCDYLFGGR